MDNIDKFEEVHISKIRAGDAIVHQGKVRTVSNNDFGESAFMGVTIFGDSYRLGTTTVKRVIWRANT